MDIDKYCNARLFECEAATENALSKGLPVLGYIRDVYKLAKALKVAVKAIAAVIDSPAMMGTKERATLSDALAAIEKELAE